MADIPGWQFFLAGVFVDAFSLYLGMQQEIKRFAVFFLIGTLLIAYGVYKMIFMKSPEEKNKLYLEHIMAARERYDKMKQAEQQANYSRMRPQATRIQGYQPVQRNMSQERMKQYQDRFSTAYRR